MGYVPALTWFLSTSFHFFSFQVLFTAAHLICRCWHVFFGANISLAEVAKQFVFLFQISLGVISSLILPMRFYKSLIFFSIFDLFSIIKV